jgi:hypothetical protein
MLQARQLSLQSGAVSSERVDGVNRCTRAGDPGLPALNRLTVERSVIERNGDNGFVSGTELSMSASVVRLQPPGPL